MVTAVQHPSSGGSPQCAEQHQGRAVTSPRLTPFAAPHGPRRTGHAGAPLPLWGGAGWRCGAVCPALCALHSCAASDHLSTLLLRSAERCPGHSDADAPPPAYHPPTVASRRPAAWSSRQRSASGGSSLPLTRLAGGWDPAQHPRFSSGFRIQDPPGGLGAGASQIK